MDLMTNQKVKFAKTHSELKHYITNFNSLTSILFGPQALLSMAMEQTKQHILENEQEYVFHFNEFPNFGAFFMHRVHVGVQKFLHSCADRSIKDINIKAIDYSPLLESIKEREIHFIRSPPWLKKR